MVGGDGRLLLIKMDPKGKPRNWLRDVPTLINLIREKSRIGERALNCNNEWLLHPECYYRSFHPYLWVKESEIDIIKDVLGLKIVEEDSAHYFQAPPPLSLPSE